MIDCNNLDSETWKRIAEADNGLLNTEAADQAKTNDNAWGYTSIVGSDDSADMTGYSQSSASNPYTGGWWGPRRKEHYLSGNAAGRRSSDHAGLQWMVGAWDVRWMYSIL